MPATARQYCQPVTFARPERLALCDLLDAVGPDAPTLCVPWTTYDLAAHLWLRETDPLAASGIIVKSLAAQTARRMSELQTRVSYPELVQRLRTGPAKYSAFNLPGVDAAANATEYFIHHEDVRRAGSAPAKPRDLGHETQDWIFRRLRVLARAFWRRARVGVVLERDDDAAASIDERAFRVSPGTHTVTLVGRPSELLLFTSGRTGVAVVERIGDAEGLAELARARLDF